MALRAQTRGRASAPCCRRRRGAALVGAVLLAAAGALGGAAFASRGSPAGAAAPRREALGGAAAALLGAAGPRAARADAAPEEGIQAAASRGKFVPLIREGYKALVAAGKVEDAWVEDKLPKMAKSMEMWAGLMRTDVASIGAVDQMAFNNLMPDKTSKRLVQEAKDFKKLAKSRDYDGAVKAFKTYLDDLATTPGKIDL